MSQKHELIEVLDNMIASNYNISNINLPADYLPLINANVNADNYELVETEPEITDIRILHFIKFCIRCKLFDDAFYDYNNVFSIIATKLNITFMAINKSPNNDGLPAHTNHIKKPDFTTFFTTKYKYKKDINFIYQSMDTDNKNYITWDEFKDFFLPFVRNVTM